MENWIHILQTNPIKRLLSSQDDILSDYVKRDLLDEKIPEKHINKEIEQIIRRQQPDGSWLFRSPSVAKYPSINHNLIETFKSVRILIGKYEMDRSREVISRSAEYIFRCRTEEGDFRGILGNQYMPYYCGMLAAYLIRAGYEQDHRIESALNWLISCRQDDGGWVVPLQTVKINKLDDTTYAADPIRADRSLPSSHLATGMALRAFAVHPVFCRTQAAKNAGALLKSRFFKPDKYNDRKAGHYWMKFHYPYWWTTLLSALDSLYSLGYTMEDRDVEKAVEWLLIHQNENGLWQTGYEKGDREEIEMNQLWVSYGICRILRKFLN